MQGDSRLKQALTSRSSHLDLDPSACRKRDAAQARPNFTKRNSNHSLTPAGCGKSQHCWAIAANCKKSDKRPLPIGMIPFAARTLYRRLRACHGHLKHHPIRASSGQAGSPVGRSRTTVPSCGMSGELKKAFHVLRHNASCHCRTDQDAFVFRTHFYSQELDHDRLRLNPPQRSIVVQGHV